MGFKDYIQELGDWLVPPKKGMYIWNDFIYKYQICMQRCSYVHVCKLRSAFCFWKIGVVSWAPDWTFPISVMQYFIPAVVFIDQCILNMRSGAITATLLSYISFLAIEIVSWMQCLFCPLE